MLLLAVVFAVYGNFRSQYFRNKALASWARDRGASVMFEGQSLLGEKPGLVWRTLNDENWFPLVGLTSDESTGDGFCILSEKDAQELHKLLSSTAPNACVYVHFSTSVSNKTLKQFIDFKNFNAKVLGANWPEDQLIRRGEWISKKHR